MINARKIHELEARVQPIHLKLFRQAPILIAALECAFTVYLLWLLLYFKPSADEELANEQSPWPSKKAKHLSRIEPYFVIQRSLVSISTVFLLISFARNLPSLMLPYVVSAGLGVLVGLIALFQENMSSLLVSTIMFQLIFELSNLCTIWRYQRLVRLRRECTWEYYRNA